jgi:hypothetical protein
MTWVYLTISIGAAGFLVWIIIDYHYCPVKLFKK